MRQSFFLAVAALVFCLVSPSCMTDRPDGGQSLRSETLLEKGWKFHRGEVSEGEISAIEAGQTPYAAVADFDDELWETVTVPHDWAIYGPFGEENDKQNVAVVQNLEAVASMKTGRTGGLPHIGVGWYRKMFSVPSGKRTALVFDGAMSDARVFVNGCEVCHRPYGYISFTCDVTDYVNEGENVLAVRLENLPQSSRWYPGAGLYRDVRLVLTEDVHVPVWGTTVQTEDVTADGAKVSLETKVENAVGFEMEIVTEIYDPDGVCVASQGTVCCLADEETVVQEFEVPSPQLWSPETPALYVASSKIFADGVLKDEYQTRFGIRTMEFSRENGFLLNGQRRKIHGVCNHHDLGPLGAAVNVAALRHQLLMLKDMGCDAIRTSHNPPAPQLVELCDELGLMMMVEAFDEWDVRKCENGYHKYFDEWAERDVVDMVRHYRNNPCVIMWSVGNEVPTQCSPDGRDVVKFLQDICHREDPTRPVTSGMNMVTCALENGFASVLDIPGINYHTSLYVEANDKLPQGFILGSETASTVSSRSVYELPAVKRYGAQYPNHQCSSYDFEACIWSNLPDVDFAMEEDYDWVVGQFVWTGFDYLGEPTPYDKNGWPNHSSMFGIIDLASIPKDRFWLYRSVWNREEPTLHVLPHWNWEGHEGENVPVFVYTSYPEAELFVNGEGYGRKRKYRTDGDEPFNGDVSGSVETRYRLMWYNVPFEAGELKVVAYDEAGNVAIEKSVHTAGEPHHIELECSYGAPELKADGKDLAYITAKVVDADGNLCPNDGRQLEFNVSGVGKYRAAANGDPTCLDLFHEPRMHAFGGMLTVIVQAGETKGTSVLTVTGEGLKEGKIKIREF